jgi:hypothetical protein
LLQEQKGAILAENLRSRAERASRERKSNIGRSATHGYAFFFVREANN